MPPAELLLTHEGNKQDGECDHHDELELHFSSIHGDRLQQCCDAQDQ